MPLDFSFLLFLFGKIFQVKKKVASSCRMLAVTLQGFLPLMEHQYSNHEESSADLFFSFDFPGGRKK